MGYAEGPRWRDLNRIISRPGAFTDEDYNFAAQKESVLNDCKILFTQTAFEKQPSKLTPSVPEVPEV
ncbi:hypothetical protein BDD12DRAFT_890800 [Trichophaea hybrida]|nr:hypothetical protein BDD12DRAFT_890800 [Trichophaea hybrida]